MIFVDTWIWLEFLGKTSEKGSADEILSRQDKILSTAALVELRYHCIKKFGLDRCEEIMYYLENDDSISILPLTIEIAKIASDIRVKYYDKKTKPLSFIDCINIATAIKSGCKEVYTGDPDFGGIEEIDAKII